MFWPRIACLIWLLAVALPGTLQAQALSPVADWPSEAVGGYTMAVLDDRGRVFITGASTGYTSFHVHDLATGTFLGEVGREGAGPGEFREIIGIAFRESRLAVADARNYRITVFDDQFEVETMFPIRMQPVGAGLGYVDDGFILLGITPGCQPNCLRRMWFVPDGERPRPVDIDSGFWRGAMDYHYANLGDSLLAFRHSNLGVWMLGRSGAGRVLVEDSTFSVQQRDFPDYFTPENGPVGGWLSGDRLILVHHRYPPSQEFPVRSPDGGPPAPVEDRRVSVIRVVDARTGQGLWEQELNILARGVLAPGLIWSMELVGMRYHFRVWQLEVPQSEEN